MKAAILFLLCAGTAAAFADVKLPAVISDHMVIQAGVPAAIWGWAAPAETVTVSFAGEKQTTVTAEDGRWMVRLEMAQATMEPRTLTVSGKNTLKVIDVLVGEAWLASGQSNMEMELKGKQHGSVDHADEEIAAAKYPLIRMFVHDAPYAIYELPVPPQEPASDRPGSWKVCSPETAEHFSAIGYFFARDLHRELKVPVGIVLSTVGGTPVEAWTSVSAQQERPSLKPVLDDWAKRLANFEPEREQQAFLEAKQAWLKQRSLAVKTGKTAPKAPSAFKNLRVMTPGGLFNGMIAPLVPYTIRGVIWYQGERNAAGPLTGLYGEQLQTLVKDWRRRWGADFFFAWMQLPRFQKEQRLPSEPNGWGVAVREGMLRALSLPNTAMAVSIDLGGVTEGHPTNKDTYARRLSLLALHDVYHQPGDGWCGPIYRASNREGERMAITFDHATGLKAVSGDIEGFAIAGSDQKFVWARASVVDDRVLVWSDAVKEPAAVRYGWAANPKCNLVNAAGLPASPFRTDGWK